MPAKLPHVLSVIAIVIAVLGATSVGQAAKGLLIPAASVGTVQLKKDAVVSSKVKNGSLLAVDFKAGQLPAGPAGPAGIAGPAGAAGPPGVSGLDVVSASSVNDSLGGLKSVSVGCPTGKKVIGGGAEIISSPLFPITMSKPLDDLSGWTARGYSDSPGAFWSVKAYAICAVVA